MKAELLSKCVGCSIERADKWAPWVTAAMECYGVTTPTLQAAFLAQIGHESGGFTILEENLRYSAAGLLQIFPKYFTENSAQAYAKKPEMIADRVYGGRMGNGLEGTGDGWKFRGRGLIQLTGKEAYQKCGKALHLDLVEKPELLLEPQWASMSAGWEWDMKGCGPYANVGNFEKVTKLINGGLNGYADRLDRWAKAKEALGV